MASRKEVRQHLAQELQDWLGDLVQAVYDHKVGDLAGQSPVVVVLSLGSERERETYRGWLARFYFSVQVWVLYASGGWTEADAEDRLDEIEMAIAEYVNLNQREIGFWEALSFEGRSEALEVTPLGGEPYLVERFTLSALVV